MKIFRDRVIVQIETHKSKFIIDEILDTSKPIVGKITHLGDEVSSNLTIGMEVLVEGYQYTGLKIDETDDKYLLTREENIIGKI